MEPQNDVRVGDRFEALFATAFIRYCEVTALESDGQRARIKSFRGEGGTSAPSVRAFMNPEAYRRLPREEDAEPQEVKVGDRFERVAYGSSRHPEGCIRTVAVTESPNKFGHIRCLFDDTDGEAFASDLLSFLWKRLPREEEPKARSVKAGDRFLWTGLDHKGATRDPWVALEGKGIKQEVTGKVLEEYPHNLLNLLSSDTNWVHLPREVAMPEAGRRVQMITPKGQRYDMYSGTVKPMDSSPPGILVGRGAWPASDLTEQGWTWEYIDDPKPAVAPVPASAIPRSGWFSTVPIPIKDIEQAFAAFSPAPQLLAHNFGDRYLTFVARRADGSKTVHLLCKGCGAMNVGAVMATACPGPRDWSADRKRGESAHAFNTDQIDKRAKAERAERAELEKKQPRSPGPGLLHAGNLVGGPQFGAWRREGC